jgi:hypothetical protein
MGRRQGKEEAATEEKEKARHENGRRKLEGLCKPGLHTNPHEGLSSLTSSGDVCLYNPLEM